MAGLKETGVIQVDPEKAAMAGDVRSDKSLNAASDDGQDEQQMSQTKIYLTMSALCLNVLLSAMDQSIVSTALPVISAEFVSSSAYTWVGSAYLLATAASGPNWGKTSDIFGRKPVVFCATILFLIGSIMCGAAHNVHVLIAGRAIAGIGGGGINLMALICVADIVPIHKRSIYIGCISSVWAFATSFAPVLGGVFTTKSTWRWCFWINLPIGGLALVGLYFFLHIETPTIALMEGLRQIDWSGTFLVVPGTVLFLYGLEVGGVSQPWSSPVTICCLVFGFALWLAFLVNERCIPKRPIMPIQIFQNRSNLAALAVCGLHGTLFIAGPYYLPLYFQSVLGATPILSGAYLLPYNFMISVSGLATSFITQKTGRYWHIIIIAFVLTALGHGLLVDLPQQAGWAKIFLYTMIAGFGIGPNFPSPMIAFQSETAKENIAVGIAAMAFVRTTCAAASIVIGGTIFSNSMQGKVPALQAAVGPDIAARLGGRTAEANVGYIGTLSSSQQDFVRGAFLDSLSNIWIFYTVAAGLGTFVAFFIRNNQLKVVTNG